MWVRSAAFDFELTLGMTDAAAAWREARNEEEGA